MACLLLRAAILLVPVLVRPLWVALPAFVIAAATLEITLASVDAAEFGTVWCWSASVTAAWFLVHEHALLALPDWRVVRAARDGYFGEHVGLRLGGHGADRLVDEDKTMLRGDGQSREISYEDRDV